MRRRSQSQRKLRLSEKALALRRPPKNRRRRHRRIRLPRRATRVPLVERLTPETAFRRFFTGVGRPSPGSVRRLLANDSAHGSWIAELDGVVIGHSSWARLAGNDDLAELAIVVDDRWQRSGVGRLLGRLASDDAASAGVLELRMVLLPDNHAAATLVRRVWPQAVSRFEDGVVVYEVAIGARVRAPESPPRALTPAAHSHPSTRELVADL